MSKTISFEDFVDNASAEDDIFLEINASGDNSVNSKAAAYTSYCWVSASVAASLSSLVSASDPANTYTELGCC